MLGVSVNTVFYPDQALRPIRAKSKQRVGDAANFLRRTVRLAVNQKAPLLYTTHSGRKVYGSSLPGEPPFRRSGKLYYAVGWKFSSSLTLHTVEGLVYVDSYGWEAGNNGVKRPHLAPAFAATRPSPAPSHPPDAPPGPGPSPRSKRMAIKHTITFQWSGPGTPVSKAIQKTGDGEQNFEVSVGAGVSNKEVAFVLDVSEIQSLYIVSDVDMLLETNSSSSPADAITLLADVPLVYVKDGGLSNPFGTDITKLFFSVAGAEDGVVVGKILKDATP